MFKHLLTRRPSTHKSIAVADRRSGAPIRRGPAPMPRMRWYSGAPAGAPYPPAFLSVAAKASRARAAGRDPRRA